MWILAEIDGWQKQFSIPDGMARSGSCTISFSSDLPFLKEGESVEPTGTFKTMRFIYTGEFVRGLPLFKGDL